MSLPDDIEFKCKDVHGADITCYKSRWDYLRKHGEMEGQQEVVKAVISSPDFINSDKEYRNRRCYYKQLVLAPPIGNTLIKVIIQKQKAFNWKRCKVINAYACEHPPAGEKLIWKKN